MAGKPKFSRQSQTFKGVIHDVEEMEKLLDIHPIPKGKHVVKYVLENENIDDDLTD
jgi:hypothetical protein